MLFPGNHHRYIAGYISYGSKHLPETSQDDAGPQQKIDKVVLMSPESARIVTTLGFQDGGQVQRVNRGMGQYTLSALPENSHM